MALNLPNFNVAQDIFITGQNYLIASGGKTVTLYYPPSIQQVSGTVPGPGNFGYNTLADGSTSLFFNTDVLSGPTGSDSSGYYVNHVRETGSIKLLCTYHPKTIFDKIKIEEEIGISFKKEKSYLHSKGKMEDYQKVLNCDYITIDMPSESIDPMKFRLISRPKDRNTIAKNLYFTCWWEQIS